MKILHVAGTHLGYSTYCKVTEERINQREMDEEIDSKCCYLLLLLESFFSVVDSV